MSFSPSFTFWKPSLTLLCCTALSTGTLLMVHSASAQTFNPPNRGAPRSATDGGTRQAFAPADRGAPDSATDGGTRTSNQLPSRLQALVPPGAMPLTLSARPEFYAYVPASFAKTVKFTLYRHNPATGFDEVLVYETQQAAPTTSGIMAFTLPEGDRYALEAGETYHWYVSLSYNPDDPTGNIAVDGWVQRLPETDAIAQQVNGIAPDLNPAAYAEAGLWYESLQAYARDRQVSTITESTPCNSATDSWSVFLNSVQLCEIAPAMFIQ